MSEMSLYEQQRAIMAMITYIEDTLPGAIKIIEEDAETVAQVFRQNGRTDLADRMMPRWMIIKTKLEELQTKMKEKDLVFLTDLLNIIGRAQNR